MITKTTRYRITIDQQEHWHDAIPSDDRIEDMVYICQARGLLFKLERVTTTEDDSIPWGRHGGGRLISDAVVLHEYDPAHPLNA